MNPTVLWQRLEAFELETAGPCLQRGEPTAKQGAHPHHINFLSDLQAKTNLAAPVMEVAGLTLAPIRQKEPSSPSAAPASTTSREFLTPSSARISQPKEPTDTIDVSPSVEVCIHEMSLHDAALDPSVHKVMVPPKATKISSGTLSDGAHPQSAIAASMAGAAQEDGDVGIHCQVVAQGFELVTTGLASQIAP